MDSGKMPTIVLETLCMPWYLINDIKNVSFPVFMQKLWSTVAKEKHRPVLNLPDTLALKFHIYSEFCLQVNLPVPAPPLPEYEGVSKLLLPVFNLLVMYKAYLKDIFQN